MIPLLFLLLLAGAKQAKAQGVSAYFGVGSAMDTAATTPGCPSGQILDSTNNCVAAAKMGGAFAVFGGDFMITPHLGFNTEYSIHFSQADYLPSDGLKVRPSFYDFNAIYQPVAGSARIVPVLEGGLGGAKMSFYFNQQSCVTPSVCTNQSGFFGSTNHFQVHGAAGVKLYVTPTIFIKPQFDARWVRNLNQQYGRNFVPEYSVAVGVTFGRP
jgi:hypothetical protein